MFLKSFRAVGGIIMGASIITGCATIASGTTQEVTFQSTPEEALVKVDGKPLGKTPLTIRLDKKGGQTLTIEKEGYKTFTSPMEVTMDSWFWGNILLGGLFGTTTDSMSGAINEYSPGQYIVTLEPENVSMVESSTTISYRENVRRFLFDNYEKLQADLSKESGETLDAALFLLNVNAEEQGKVISEIRKIMFTQEQLTDESDTASSKVERIIEKYIG